jgi:hypothetical protein
MKVRHTRPFIATLFICLSVVSTATAGTIIRLDTEMFGQEALSGSALIYLQGELMRIDSSEGGGDVTVIYNGAGRDNPFYWLIYNADSSYVEIRRDELLEAKAVAEEAMKRALGELEGLPPEERRLMEKQIAERVGYAPFLERDTEYKKVSSGIKISGWRCNHYQGFRDGRKVEEVWAADLAELGIDPTDLVALEELADLFKTVGQDLPALFRFGGEDSEVDKTFPGFPVVVVSYDDAGERAEKSTVKEIRRQKLEGALFELPEGLRKRNVQLRP